MADASSKGFSAQRGLVDQARALHQLGRYRELLQLLLPRLHDLDDAHYDNAACLAANAHARLGDYETARQISEAALARNPASDAAHAQRATALWGLERHRAALDELYRAIALAPEHAEYRYLEAVMHLDLWRRRGRNASSTAGIAEFDAAEEAIHRALALDPNDPRYYAFLADFLLSSGAIDVADDARDLVKKGLALDPTYAELLGLQAQLATRRDEKVGLLRSALRFDPNHAGRQEELAVLTRHLRRDLRIAAAYTALSLAVLLWASAGLNDFDNRALTVYKEASFPLLNMFAFWLTRNSRPHRVLVGVFIAVNLCLFLVALQAVPDLGSAGLLDGAAGLLAFALGVALAGYVGMQMMRFLAGAR